MTFKTPSDETVQDHGPGATCRYFDKKQKYFFADRYFDPSMLVKMAKMIHLAKLDLLRFNRLEGLVNVNLF